MTDEYVDLLQTGQIGIEDLKMDDRIHVANIRIKGAVHLKCPESKLFLGIIKRAVDDLGDRSHDSILVRRKAKAYLMQDSIYNAELIGLDSDWIRDTLRTLRLL